MNIGRAVLIIAIVDFLLLLVGLVSWAFISADYNKIGLAAAFAGVVITTLFGFMLIGVKTSGKIDDYCIRLSVTISFIAAYLLLVSIVSIQRVFEGETPPMTESVLASFTTTVGIVIAFYFGSTAYLERRRPPNQEPPKAP